MEIMEAIDRIVGTKKTIEIGGTEITVFPLTYEEYLKALRMAPPATYTAEELEEYDKTEKLPLKPVDAITAQKAMEQQMYVIGVTLKKNDATFDINALKADIRLFYAFQPLYNAVMEESNPSGDMIKKKDSTT